MTTKVAVNTEIRVNGQAYASADAMPPDIRQVYERALEWIDGGTYKGPLSIFTARSASTGDGNTSVDHGAAVRKTPALGAPQTNQAVPLDGAIRSILAASVVGNARPESTTWRLFIAGMVVAAVLSAGFMFAW